MTSSVEIPPQHYSPRPFRPTQSFKQLFPIKSSDGPWLRRAGHWNTLAPLTSIAADVRDRREGPAHQATTEIGP